MNPDLRPIVNPLISCILYGPISRARTVLQCQNELKKQGKITRSYTGYFNCFKRIIRNEGFVGLWTGTLGMILQRYAQSSADFLIPDARFFLPASLRNTFGANLALILNSIPLYVVVCPFEYIHARMSADVFETESLANGPQFSSTWDLIRRTPFRKYFRGFTAGLLAPAVFLISRTILFESAMQLMKALRISPDEYPALTLFMMSTASAGASVASYPLATLRRRMILAYDDDDDDDVVDAQLVPKISAIGLAKRIYAEEGIGGFFGGVSLNVVAAYVGYAVAMLVAVARGLSMAVDAEMAKQQSAAAASSGTASTSASASGTTASQ